MMSADARAQCECRGECGGCPPGAGHDDKRCSASAGVRYGVLGDARRVLSFDFYQWMAAQHRSGLAEAAATGREFAAALRCEDAARAVEDALARFSRVEPCVLLRDDDAGSSVARCPWCRRALATRALLAGHGPTETAWMEAGL